MPTKLHYLFKTNNSLYLNYLFKINNSNDFVEAREIKDVLQPDLVNLIIVLMKQITRAHIC